LRKHDLRAALHAGDARYSVSWAISFFRYLIVGVLSNSVSYLLYLVATALGGEPKIVMTALYGVGVLQTFPFNKHWSFRDKGPASAVLVRYCIAYATGYALNYAALAVFVGHLHLAHQYVQAIMVVLLGPYLYGLQRVWVFAPDRELWGEP
jgi:putative flippase GtrA